MAAMILIPVAKQILGKAADLAVEQIGLLWNFRRELKKLKDTVLTIQAVLRDAEEKQFHNHQVKLWLEKLSDVMYDADDLLDDLSTEARRKAMMEEANEGRRTTMTTSCWSVVCFLFFSLPGHLVYDLKMAHAVKAIREKLDLISRDKEDFHLEVLTVEEALPSRETDSCPPMIVVGREDDKKNIIQLLFNSDNEANITVVPIVGMGGLGKTTLAQLVFDDEQVETRFDIKVWVHVSQSFDIKVIIGKMLRSLGRGSHAGLELDDLQSQLRREIKGRRFLFALDDVWEEKVKSWETLGKYLIVGSPGSKVLVTTRSTKVAEVSSVTLKSETSTGVVVPYLLQGLSIDESWNLLVKKALNGIAPRNPAVERIGRKILEKCHGFPLAIGTVSGLLSSKNPESEWELFLRDGLKSINKEETSILSTLKLSFNHLPSAMKKCFAYCALFPKGYLFEVEMLVQLWIAQGYIDSEDKGFDCFKTLWWRSFFEKVHIFKYRNMSSCFMHDMMHDLAVSVSGENILKISSLKALKSIPSNTRHLALIEEDDNDIGEETNRSYDELGNVSRARTLICHRTLSKEECEQILLCLRCLRALVMFRESSYVDSSSFGKLKHLRYLGFNCYGVNKLPDSVTNLVNLQVLKLMNTSSLKELPRDIKKLINLKHLDFKLEHVRYHIPKGIGELKLLQTLTHFVVSKRSSSSDNEGIAAALVELEGLNALRGKLTIRNLTYTEALGWRGVYVLKEKLYLESLELDFGGYADDDDDHVTTSARAEGILENLWPHLNLKQLIVGGGYRGLKVPNWLSGLTNLVEFSLKDSKHCEYLPPLHQMSSLKKLHIKNCPQLKGVISNGSSGDQCNTSPDNSTAVTQEEDEDGPCFRCLDCLCINDCPKLTRMPTFPNVEGELDLSSARVEPLARTMKMKTRKGGGVDCSDEYNSTTTNEYNDTNILFGCPSSSSLFCPLSKLTKLVLRSINDDLASLPDDDVNCYLISLQELIVWNCCLGVKLPSSLCSSTSLTRICLSLCGTVEYLPPVHKLPSLKELSIRSCRKLRGCWWTNKKKQVNNRNHNDGADDPSTSTAAAPLVGEEHENEDREEWSNFPRLSTLEINDCPNLTQMPPFPCLDLWLLLDRTSSQALVRTLKIKRIAAVGPLSKLRKLHLKEIVDLESLQEGLSNLTSLNELLFSACPRLASLPPAMQHLTSLQKLYIWRCPQLAKRCRKGEGEDWPNISHIPNIRVDGEILQESSSGT